MASIFRSLARRTSSSTTTESSSSAAAADEHAGLEDMDNGPLEGFDLGVQHRDRGWSTENKDSLGKLELPLSKEQLAAIAQVRERCKEDLAYTTPYPEVVSDRRILRFLRGHKFNMEVACEYYRNMLKWRKRHNVDAIRDHIVKDCLKPNDFPGFERFVRFYPTWLDYCRDKKNRPVTIERIGAVVPKKFLSCFALHEWLKFHIYCCEYTSILLDNLSVENNKVTRLLLIYDLGGCGPHHIRSKSGIDLFKKTVALTQDNYPETMEDCFLLNVPRVFSIAWGMLKPMLAERTAQKIQIIGNKDLEKLHAVVPKELLPRTLGGDRDDEWPLFNRDWEALDKMYTELDVPKGVSRTVTQVIPAGSFVTWGFYTKSGDINVTVSTTCQVVSQATEVEEEKGSEDSCDELKNNVVQKLDRSDCSGGSIAFQQEGNLTIVFDNTFSWINRKSISYYVRHEKL